MNKIKCFLKTIWLGIIHLMPISGHNYLLMYENKDVQILQCKDCGDISFAWKNEKLMNEYQDFVSKERNVR